jgi:Tfp pilus assembly protein PilV
MSNKPATRKFKKWLGARGRRLEAGFTLVEAVVAMTVFVIGVVGLIQVTLVARTNSEIGRDVVQASNYLQEGVEAVRSIRDASWTNISSLTPATNYRLNSQPGVVPPWTLTAGSEPIGQYTRTVRLDNVRREDTNGSGTLNAGDKICVGAGCGQFDDADTKKATVTVSWTQGSRTITRSLNAYLTNWQ